MRVTYLGQALGTGGMGKGGREMPPYGYSDGGGMGMGGMGMPAYGYSDGCLTDSNGIKQEGGYDG
jgi:hypothetical protein